MQYGQDGRGDAVSFVGSRVSDDHTALPVILPADVMRPGSTASPSAARGRARDAWHAVRSGRRWRGAIRTRGTPRAPGPADHGPRGSRADGRRSPGGPGAGRGSRASGLWYPARPGCLGARRSGCAVHQPGPRPRRVRAQKKQNPKTPRSVYTLLDYLFSHDETPKITAWVAAQVARAAWVCELGMPTDHEHDKYMEDGTDTQRTRITASCTAYAYFRFSLRSESRVDSSVAAGSVSHHA